MRSAGGQLRQTTTAEVRVESRPTARESREIRFNHLFGGYGSFIWRIEAGLLALVPFGRMRASWAHSSSGSTADVIRSIFRLIRLEAYAAV
jgi:hypothetical protein